MFPLLHSLKPKQSSPWGSRRGAGKLTLLVFGGLTAAVLFCAYNIIPFYYYHYELINQFESHIRAASTYTDLEIRNKLMYHIKKMELPVEARQLQIERGNGVMRIRLKYQEVFYITFRGKEYDIHRFDFDADVQGPMG